MTAVEMATVDLTQAAAQLEQASVKFVEMNRVLGTLLERQRSAVHVEVEAAVRRAELANSTIAVAGAFAAALLVVLSLGLARLLSASLQAQIGELTALSTQAGAQVADEGGHEVTRIGRAITAFRGALRRVQDNERALSAANNELLQARDELELRVAERTRELRIYAQVISSTGEAVAIAGPDGRIVEVNAAFEGAAGRDSAEVIGTPMYAAESGPHPEGFYREIWRTVENADHWSGEILQRRRDGETFPTWATINALRDEQGRVTHYVSVWRDVSTLKQAEQQLQQLAFYDSLTGLANRALFNDRLGIAVLNARRRNTGLAVMYIDLDRFKFVNDSLGHAAGDQLLIEIGQRIKRCVRSTDTVARMGGDEFTVLLTESSAETDAVQIAGRLIEAVAQPVSLRGEDVYVGASIGIALYPQDAQDAEAIKKHADVAMYEAKQAGRGQYCVFDPAMMARVGDRVSLSARIENALRGREFTLVYQPIIDAASGKPVGAEALIRWPQSDGNMMEPMQFIPHAEEAGLIRRIDEWVLETACRDAVGWQARAPLRLAVNVSAISLQQPGLAELIESILAETGLPPAQLAIEITETAVIADPEAARVVLEQISALGVSLSMDDFGTGYSTLDYLVRFPLSTIKLDQSFVARIGKDRASEAVIGSLLQLGRHLDLRMIAEGVEDAEQQAFLEKAGCEFVQGFHLSRPLPADHLEQWLADHRPAGEA
jgi:diguanylate cyclase (GGDEF)-like protein/PAS domain S-box-containing protein